MKILRPCGLKKIAKEAQRYPIRLNLGHNHSLGRSRRSNKLTIVRADLPEATTVRPW